MDAIRENGELEVGVLVGGVVHRAFTIRPATLADTYRAAESVVVPATLNGALNGPESEVEDPARVAQQMAVRVAYQMAVDDAQILCQVEALGSLSPVPSPQALAAELDPDDMAILRRAAVSVKKKWRDSRLSLPLIGEPNISSSAPASI